jgi:dGTPase
VQILGETHDERIRIMMTDLIANSQPENGEMVLNMSDRVFDAMTDLRHFLYDKVYRSPRVHNEFIKAKKIMSELYTYFLENEPELTIELEKMQLPTLESNDASKERQVCDLLACMTDRYALSLYARTFFPSPTF